MTFNFDDITLRDLKKIKQLLDNSNDYNNHPMLGKRCLVRTYSAGVHIGDIEYINGMEAKLTNSLRLWKWSDGGLSLSAIANNGVINARLNFTGEIYLTNIIEFIPTTKKAEETFLKFIEDEK